MIYDFAIIGGGPAGLSAAIYAARFRLKTVVFAKEPGGALSMIHLMENWPGDKSLAGYELGDRLSEHAKSLGVEIFTADVKSVKKTSKTFLIENEEGKHEAKSLLIATGTKHRKLCVPGEEEFHGKGVSYCAICDAAFFRNKVVAVIGGSDSAVCEALILSEHASKVYLIYRRDKIRAEPINDERLIKNKKVTVILNTNVTSIKGGKFVSSLALDKTFNGSNELAVDGVFVAIGYEPQNDIATQLGVKLDPRGEIIIGCGSETNIPGVFAAGDVTSGTFKQVITAAAQGVVASHSAYNYLGGKWAGRGT